jgi:hypothetical protein
MRAPRGTALALSSDVTIRITGIEKGGRRVVRVDGWLAADDVAALEGALGDRVRGTRIELADLRSADAAGVSALRDLEARGALLHRPAPFLRLLLGQRRNGEPTSGTDHD